MPNQALVIKDGKDLCKDFADVIAGARDEVGDRGDSGLESPVIATVWVSSTQALATSRELVKPCE